MDIHTYEVKLLNNKTDARIYLISRCLYIHSEVNLRNTKMLLKILLPVLVRDVVYIIFRVKRLVLRGMKSGPILINPEAFDSTPILKLFSQGSAIHTYFGLVS